MHACADAVYGIENITFHRASNVPAGCVAAKAVKTQSEILAQLKILQKKNLIEDLEKVEKYEVEHFSCSKKCKISEISMYFYSWADQDHQ